MTSPTVRCWPGPVLRLVAGGELAALALLAGGWYGASGQLRVGQQLAWISLSVVGVLVGGMTNAALLLAARRSLGRRRRLLDGAPPVAAPAMAGDAPVAGVGMTRYHRPTCRLVAGKPVMAAPAEAHRRAGRAACGVCQPCPGSGVPPT